ncbi:glycine--tRNA ligase [bacterium]|nr:glycine--tRNA ligase [bacterium]NUN45697.1 glycine--tRNA ligase [bacterium]
MSTQKPLSGTELMDKIVSLCKRRGFIFQSSEIYGGLNGCWDYGPLGVELLKNYKDAWWKAMTFRDDIEGLDAAILMHPRVWEASGHVENFTDPMVDCKECKARFREDQIEDSMCGNKAYQGRKAHKCMAEGKFTEARQFNLMFKTYIGPLEDSSAVVYLRPETAQGIYVNFHNVKDSSRQKVPFGIAQIGKAFRNEINTKNFLFRTREFEQMEMQFFVKPGTDMEWFNTWKENRKQWYLSLGFTEDKLKFHAHEKLAHYAAAAFDIEFLFPFGWGEIEGIHNRTDFDLKRHQEYCGKNLDYFDDTTKEKYLPYVIETSAGASRGVMASLVNAYAEEEAPTGDGKTETRVVMKFHPTLAPVKAAILPLVKKDGMPEVSMTLYNELKKHYKIFYDESATVGKRYRRQDEIGTPYCFTIDSETLQNQTVTVRHRDSMTQERIAMDQVLRFLRDNLNT